MREGWVTKTLGEVCCFQRGLTYSKKDEVACSGMAVLRANNIDLNTHSLNFNDLKWLREPFEVPETKKIKRNSLLICTASGSKSHLGKVAYIDIARNMAFGGFMGLLIPNTNILGKYLFYSLISSEYKEFISKLSDGVNINNLKFDHLKQFVISFPKNIEEQQRIVAILDAAFADIAQAKANAERNLANGNHIFKSELNNLFIVGEKDWEAKKLKTITSKIGSGATPKGGKNSYVREGIPFVRSLNVHDVLFSFKNLARLQDVQATALKNVTLHKNDILLNITGASIARCCVLPDECVGGRVNQHVAIIRLNDSRILPAFLCYALVSMHYKNKLLFIGDSAGSTRQALTKTDIEDFTVSFPSFLNQQRIVARLDELSGHCKKLEALYSKKIALYDELKQSLLAKAFRGELV